VFIPPPRLPKLKAQASAPPLPDRRKGNTVLDTYPCGSVWTGEEEIPLECDAPMDDSHYGTPAVALIPYSLLRAPHGALPTTVDHRTDGFEGRTLKQGRAGACTAFALASNVNHAMGLWTGTPGDVSVMQMWARYHHAQGQSAILANLGRTVTADAEWPYDASRAMAWMKCRGNGASCLSDDERRKLAEADKKGVVILEQVERLPMDDILMDVIQAKLSAGRDIGVAGRLPKSFHPLGEAGSKYIPDFKQLGRGGHAFSIVGYTRVEDERYFLAKNSWGERWGDNGYAWIHEQSLRKMIHAAYVVVVDPVAGVGLRRHRRQKAWVAACAGHEAPDSVDGACKPTCPDGGPRHSGYCGTAEDCTKGFVNVAGECVIAAPKASGTEPKTGIAFHCSPSGCLYTLPHGVAGCTEGKCQKSCPAPDYRLGQGKGGLLCLE